MLSVAEAKESESEIEKKYFPVIEIANFVLESILTQIKNYLSPKLIRQATHSIILTDTVKSVLDENLLENVSDLNGLAIPAMLEVEHNHTHCSMYSQLHCAYHDEDVKMHPYVKEMFLLLKKPHEMTSPNHYLELAAVYQSGAYTYTKGFISRLYHIGSYHWMSQQKANQCLSVLRSIITDYHEGYYEEILQYEHIWTNAEGKKMLIKVEGQVDLRTPTILWEIKCVRQLCDEHFIQLGLYAWLWRHTRVSISITTVCSISL